MSDYHINVYRDKKGDTHFSTDEFAIGDRGTMSFDDALEEAYRFTVKGFKDGEKWEYFCTLTTDNPNATHLMQMRLARLVDLYQRAESIGLDTGDLFSSELFNAIQEHQANKMRGAYL